MPENSPEKLLFERHQEMLEENTEKLHECTESANVFTADRTQVVNWTRITERFLQSVLDNYVDGVVVPTQVASSVDVEQIDRWLRPAAAAAEGEKKEAEVKTVVLKGKK